MKSHYPEIYRRILDALSRRWRIDLRYFLSGGLWLSIGQLISTLLFLCQAVVFGYFLSKEVYGTYNFVMSFASLLYIPTLTGMTTALIQATANGYDGTLGLIVRTRIKWGLLGTATGVFLALFYFLNHNGLLGAASLLVAATVPFVNPLGTYDSLLQGRKLFKISVLYATIIQILTTVLSISVALLSQSIFLLLLAYYVPTILLNAFFLVKVLRQISPKARVDAGAVTYGKHLSLIDVINVVAGISDRLLVFHFLGASSLAIYSFATSPPDQIKGFLAPLNNLALPKVSVTPEKVFRQEIWGYFVKLFIFGAVVIGSYILVAPFIYRVFFPKYQAAVVISQLYSLSMLNFALFPALTYLQAKRKVKEQYISNLVTPVFQIASMTLLTVYFGLIGLIWARIMSRFLGSLLATALFLRTSTDTT